ncbi:hypothetical protein AHMF7616_00700 [Adhaeribacter pallidiroseus]|uniref:Uncharacterized protein n=1 Tax=Adhaeribacter pallidiroseus TaxID=2072847 RepID=A0A369QGU0_9BACT|nr:hypothetical protein AHMF7616_00700 [Adhaeribacter pallidiroseus]
MLNEAISEVKKSEPTYFADDKSVNRNQVHVIVGVLASNFLNEIWK